MAEIKIEKKKPVWPWILLALVLVAAIAYFVYANNENDDFSDDNTMEEVDDMASDTINNSNSYNNSTDYSDSQNVTMQYSESIQDSMRIGTDSTYTKTALYNLAKAVTSKAAQYNLESSKATEDLKNFTLQMDGMVNTTMPKMTGISKNLKTVSNDIVSVLETIQTKSYPVLQKEVAELKQTSNKLTAMSLEKQKMTLQTFFRKANEVLAKMNL